jgi:ElaB/YqjD/DUF883 family membrane-anchored ribosome-binding protein
MSATNNPSEQSPEGVPSPTSQAHELGKAAAQATDATLSSLGESLSALAGAIRERAPNEGVLGSAASTVADRLESGSHYLAQHGVNGIAEDLSALIRKHPLPAIGVALGIGWLLGAYMRRS